MADGSLTLDFTPEVEAATLPFWEKVKTRVTIKELSPTSYSFVMEAQGPDGKWARMMESTNTKMP